MTLKTFCIYMIALSRLKLTPKIELVWLKFWRAVFSNFFCFVLERLYICS